MNTPEKRASALLKEAAIRTPPTPIESLAKKVGARLVFEPFEGEISGLLFRDGASVVIGVNSTDTYTRQRFTIAHEIGHLLLHKGQTVFVDKPVRLDAVSSMGTEVQEIDANRFAAELLMPRPLVIEEVQKRLKNKKKGASERLIGGLARAFKVSTQAMEYRLINLGMYIPQ